MKRDVFIPRERINIYYKPEINKNKKDKELIMPVKKGTTRKSTVKKDSSAAKKTTRPELKDFLQEVEAKAYDLYQARLKSGIPNDDIADWFQAEKEIKEKYNL
jgi:thymidylate synthase ThyX